MIRTSLLSIFLAFLGIACSAQELRWFLDSDSVRYIKLQIATQVWARYNQNNPGTLRQGEAVDESLDFGVRRARIQCFAQVTERASFFLHYGFNNYNTNTLIGSNRRLQAFFHDAMGEYRFTAGNELKVGLGLSFVNGLSRFSQPAVVNMPTMDVPVFAQPTVEQLDIFGRKLSLSARGQIGHIDYRFALSDAFPVTSSGLALQPFGSSATFAQKGHSLQRQAYIIWQFLDHEPHQIPNMSGSYFGNRKIWNVAGGVMHQPKAMWRKVGSDTVYEDMLLIGVETMFDSPIDSSGTTLSAFASYFFNDYGRNYLRYNGVMNTGTSIERSLDTTQLQPLTQYGPSYGNAFPMYGTGRVFYTHVAMLFPRSIDQMGVMPYISAHVSWFDRLNKRPSLVVSAGCSLLMNTFRSRLTLDVQNRPTYGVSTIDNPFGELQSGERKIQVVVQYQLVL